MDTSELTVPNILYGLVLALGALVMKLFKSKLDELTIAQKASELIVAEHVSRTELTVIVNQLREDKRVMHEDNRENLVGLRDDVRAIHNRIDKLTGDRNV
jgi:hypothetical protein